MKLDVSLARNTAAFPISRGTQRSLRLCCLTTARHINAGSLFDELLGDAQSDTWPAAGVTQTLPSSNLLMFFPFDTNRPVVQSHTAF